MADKTKKKRMVMITNGPSLMELQFSDYHLPGHTIDFMTEETDGAMVRGEIFRVTGKRLTFTCQVTGSDRIERSMKDALGQDIPWTARLIRVRIGYWRWEGWYNPISPRRGLLREV